MRPARVAGYAIVAAFLLAGCTSHNPDPRPSPVPPTVDGAPQRIALNRGPFKAGPVPVPAVGAYVG
ncbi:MAG TPA: endoglucanase, partial [Micromonosporaceae bacterium]|nr:endoglucanase [Micromonosporaceae bacterium]